VSNLDTNSFTYVSDAHGTGRWLDHFIVTKSAYKLISSTKILHDVYWSDHFPLLTKCRLSAVIPKIALESNSCNKIKWGNRNEEQIKCYTELCNENLKLINFPLDFVKCSHGFCNDLYHRKVIDKLYKKIVYTLSSAAIKTNKSSAYKPKKRTILGWNMHVGAAHREARSKFVMWVL
jgi:hypothetical protein